jgi:hypothetical protein
MLKSDNILVYVQKTENEIAIKVVHLFLYYGTIDVISTVREEANQIDIIGDADGCTLIVVINFADISECQKLSVQIKHWFN